jgi:hypothetical protein
VIAAFSASMSGGVLPPCSMLAVGVSSGSTTTVWPGRIFARCRAAAACRMSPDKYASASSLPTVAAPRPAAAPARCRCETTAPAFYDGVVREGYFADLVAFDPATIGADELERVYDQPGGADRLVAWSIGLTHTWVNGVAIRVDGADVPGVVPGTLLRG